MKRGEEEKKEIKKEMARAAGRTRGVFRTSRSNQQGPPLATGGIGCGTDTQDQTGKSLIQHGTSARIHEQTCRQHLCLALLRVGQSKLSANVNVSVLITCATHMAPGCFFCSRQHAKEHGRAPGRLTRRVSRRPSAPPLLRNRRSARCPFGRPETGSLTVLPWEAGPCAAAAGTRVAA